MLFLLTVCICTRNRPNELKSAVESVLRSSQPVHEIIVSDDSTDEASRLAMLDYSEPVRFIEGPRRGLCANRNTALNAVTGTHVLFIDDDVIMDATFVEKISRALDGTSDSKRLIVSGCERNNGKVVCPNDVDFLGFQSRPYRPEDRIRTVVINAAVFPNDLFTSVRFDENLVYGNDEVDFATRAVESGYRIQIVPSAMNDHFPANSNRDYYRPFVEASRLYVTFKRYFDTEKRPLKAALYAAVGPSHLLASSLRRRPQTALSSTWRSTKQAAAYVRRFNSSRSA